jgi:predicted dehydrogenase
MSKKVVIIGCGAISEMWHIPVAVKLLGANNVAIVDSNRIRLEAVAQKFNVLSLAHELSGIKIALDAAIIGAPPQFHPVIAKTAFATGLEVLCEKPLANSSQECAAMLEAADAADKLLAVCHTARFFPNRHHVRKLITEGALGKIIRVDIEQGSVSSWPTLTGYSFRKDMVPGGVLLNEGIHSLDFLFWTFGKPMAYAYFDDSLGGVENNSKLRLSYQGDMSVDFRLSRSCELANTIRIEGNKCVAEFGIYDLRSVDLSDGGRKERILCSDKKLNFLDVAELQMMDFLASVDGKRKPRCSALEGAAVVEFIEQCYLDKKKRNLPEKVPYPGYTW